MHQQTRLDAVIQGPMRAHLKSNAQLNTMNNWIESGAKEKDFNTIKPIFDKQCVICHSTDNRMGIPSLTAYQSVAELTDTDTGASIQSLVRISHIHMFGIPFLLFLIGRIFILCEMKPMHKRILVAIPFIAVFLDIFSWYLTKIIPGFAWLVVIGGALMGLSIAVQIVISLYQMWIADHRPEVS